MVFDTVFTIIVGKLHLDVNRCLVEAACLVMHTGNVLLPHDTAQQIEEKILFIAAPKATACNTEGVESLSFDLRPLGSFIRSISTINCATGWSILN